MPAGSQMSSALKVCTFPSPRPWALQDPAEAGAVLIFPITMLTPKFEQKRRGGLGKHFLGYFRVLFFFLIS